MDNKEETPPLQRTLYFFSLRWCTYCALATITFLSKIVPTTRLFAFFVLLGYAMYMLIDTYKLVSIFEQQHRDTKKSIRWSFITNGQDFVFFVLAVLIGVCL